MDLEHEINISPEPGKSEMQLAANVTSGDPVDWHAINWKHV